MLKAEAHVLEVSFSLQSISPDTKFIFSRLIGTALCSENLLLLWPMKEWSVELWRVLTYVVHGMAASVLLLKAEKGMKPDEKQRESQGA